MAGMVLTAVAAKANAVVKLVVSMVLRARSKAHAKRCSNGRPRIRGSRSANLVASTSTNTSSGTQSANAKSLSGDAAQSASAPLPLARQRTCANAEDDEDRYDLERAEHLDLGQQAIDKEAEGEGEQNLDDAGDA